MARRIVVSALFALLALSAIVTAASAPDRAVASSHDDAALAQYAQLRRSDLPPPASNWAPHRASYRRELRCLRTRLAVTASSYREFRQPGEWTTVAAEIRILRTPAAARTAFRSLNTAARLGCLKRLLVGPLQTAELTSAGRDPRINVNLPNFVVWAGSESTTGWGAYLFTAAVAVKGRALVLLLDSWLPTPVLPDSWRAQALRKIAARLPD